MPSTKEAIQVYNSSLLTFVLRNTRAQLILCLISWDVATIYVLNHLCVHLGDALPIAARRVICEMRQLEKVDAETFRD